MGREIHAWMLGSGQGDRQGGSPRAAVSMEGRIAVGFEAEWFKVHQWEPRDTEQIPSDGGLQSLARDTQQDGKLLPGSAWKAVLTPASRDK